MNTSAEFQQPFKFESRSLVVAGRNVVFEVGYLSPIRTTQPFFASFVFLLTLPQGYFTDVPLDPNKANANLANLVQNNWLDAQTRRLRITLEMWNLQLDQVIVMFWDTEFNPGGHIRKFFSATVVRVDFYDKASDSSRMGLEIICVLFWVYYLFSEWEQVYKAYK